MAQVNPLTRELLVKLVYYGPGLGGKTTSLQRIHQSSPPETRGQLVSLATPVDRTLYFDFLPLRARSVRDHQVRLQLFTVPGQVYFNATRKLVLTGADGVVFVADSQRERHDANLESLENLAANLEEQGRRMQELALVFQYNKRDIEGVMSIEEMERSLNPMRGPSFPTVATRGNSVLEALDRLVEDVIEDLEARGAFGPVGSASEEPSFAQPEQALEEQIGHASEDAWKVSVERALQVNQSAFPESPLKGEPRVQSAFPSHSFPSHAGARAHGPSWAPLFEHPKRIQQLEADFTTGRISEGIVLCDEIVADLLDGVATTAGIARSDSAVLAPWLGVSGPRWLTFRRIVRRARDGGPLDIRDGLYVYAVLLELRLALQS